MNPSLPHLKGMAWTSQLGLGAVGGQVDPAACLGILLGGTMEGTQRGTKR